ncbi:hypothetical protein MED222_06400 [Vibrio sp. MED222]|nr:hypothetical protein MED222_06400 [Vibrio sp. MED222]
MKLGFAFLQANQNTFNDNNRIIHQHTESDDKCTQ